MTNSQNLPLEKLKFGLMIERILKRLPGEDNDLVEQKTLIADFTDESAKEVYEKRKREYIFSDTDDLTESDEPKAIEDFLKQHKQQMKQIAKLNYNEPEVETFLINNIRLISEHSLKYLQKWASVMHEKNVFHAVSRLGEHVLTIRYIVTLMKEGQLDSVKAIRTFFRQMKFNGYYQQKFADDLNLFEQFIDDWDVKNNDLDFDENKEKKRQEQLGEGGLDPVEVVKLLPMDLLICVKSRDVTKLQNVLLNMPREKAAEYLDLCINSGLLVKIEEDFEGDEEAAAPNNNH